MKQQSIIYFGLVLMVSSVIFLLLQVKSNSTTKLVENSTSVTYEIPDDPMLNQIREGIKKDYPYLATLESPENKLEIKTEDLLGEYAIGKYSFSQDSFGGSGTWFARNTAESWIVFNVGYNYWGDCKDFWDNKFPKEMTPDCFDEEKMEHIETMNPTRFFVDGFNIKDKEEIIQAYVIFKKSQSEKVAKKEDLAIRVGAQTKDYLEGMMLTEKIEQNSNPTFLAARTKEGWKVVFEGQDIPYCDLVDSVNFPVSIVPECIIRGKDYGLYDKPEIRLDH